MTSIKAAPRRRSRLLRHEWAWGYALIAPTIVGLCVLNIYPFFYSIWLSLQKLQGLTPAKYIGFKNYTDLFKDKLVMQATWNTLYFMLLTVPVGVFLALFMATLLNNKIRCRDLYRGIYFLPLVVAPAAIAMVWRWMFNTENGIINQFLGIFGVTGPNWLSDPNTAIVSCAIISIWSSLGYDLVLLLAGLQSIPQNYYEACDIDGAGPFRKFFNITVPLVSPTLFFVVVLRVMSAIKAFDVIYMLIKDTNPAFNKGVTLMVLFYREAFTKFNKGYGSAIVMWSFVIIGILTALQFVAEKKLVHYD
jgi:multiple sugar transport system permease protein